jgi:Fic-DOC domain mobile mystery protein B
MLGTALPGETPIPDASGLRIRGITTREELSYFEAENVRKAHVKYLATKPTRATAPFDLSWALRLHEQMFGDVWKWAGNVRTCDLNIGVPYQHVETCLHQLTQNLPVWETSRVRLLEQAAWLHHQAVHIHPFLNGNGRWSRMLANIWLKQHDEAITIWPEETIGAESKIRQEYLAAIRQADEGNYDPLIELHRQYADIPLDWLGNSGSSDSPHLPRGPARPWLYGGGTTAPP